jgi:hypothetical protein
MVTNREDYKILSCFQGWCREEVTVFRIAKPDKEYLKLRILKSCLQASIPTISFSNSSEHY